MPNILLIDEDDAFDEVAAYRLERAGFDVERTRDTSEGWRSLQRERFDAVIIGGSAERRGFAS